MKKTYIIDEAFDFDDDAELLDEIDTDKEDISNLIEQLDEALHKVDEAIYDYDNYLRAANDMIEKYSESNVYEDYPPCDYNVAALNNAYDDTESEMEDCKDSLQVILDYTGSVEDEDDYEDDDNYDESLNRNRLNEATEAKDIEKFRNVDFNYDYPVRRETGPGVQFDSLSSKFRAFLKNICQRNGWELVKYSKNYYYCTAYIKDENDNYIYINLGDVRYMFGKKWIDDILYRKAIDDKDCTGGQNRGASIAELERALQKLFDNYDFTS